MKKLTDGSSAAAVTIKNEYSTKELSEMLGISERTVRRKAEKEGWEYREEKKGAVSVRWYKQPSPQPSPCEGEGAKEEENKRHEVLTRNILVKEAKSVDELPDYAKEIAMIRYGLCMKLHEKIELYGAGNKLNAISEFTTEAKEKYKTEIGKLPGFSEGSMRRWYTIYEKNRDNPVALAPDYGKNRGKRIIPVEVQKKIIEMWGTENKLHISTVVRQLQLQDINVSYHVVRDFIEKDIPLILKSKMRNGKKKHEDNFEDYISRSYEELPNEIWVSDGHEMEVFVKHPTKEGCVVSPKLIVWQDYATRMWVGWSIALEETSEAIIDALRMGVERYGIPKCVQTDNGKAYKAKAMKGKDVRRTSQTQGRRTSDIDNASELKITGIYGVLGIERITHAIPYNAKSKGIERAWQEIKNFLNRSLIGYKGGSIAEKPERLKEDLKKESILEYEELERLIEMFVEYRNHNFYDVEINGKRGHRGAGMNDRTPLERWNQEIKLTEIRKATPEQLRAATMYEAIGTVRRGGRITLFGQEYKSSELGILTGEKIKIRYSRHDLTKIYVYDSRDRFTAEAEIEIKQAFFTEVKQIKENAKEKKKINKMTKELVMLMQHRKDTDPKLALLNNTEKEIIEHENEKEKIEEAELRELKEIKSKDGQQSVSDEEEKLEIW